jgi:hypothetical protein
MLALKKKREAEAKAAAEAASTAAASTTASTPPRSAMTPSKQPLPHQRAGRLLMASGTLVNELLVIHRSMHSSHTTTSKWFIFSVVDE